MRALKRYRHAAVIPFYKVYPNDTQNSTTSTTYVQLDARSIHINFDDLPRPPNTRLFLRFVAAHRTTDATVPAYIRLTHEAYAGASPASGTLFEHSTTVTSFADEASSWFSPWIDVTNWTGVHEFNVSHCIGGVATSYVHGTSLELKYEPA